MPSYQRRPYDAGLASDVSVRATTPDSLFTSLNAIVNIQISDCPLPCGLGVSRYVPSIFQVAVIPIVAIQIVMIQIVMTQIVMTQVLTIPRNA